MGPILAQWTLLLGELWFNRDSWGILHKKYAIMVWGEITGVHMEPVSEGPPGCVKYVSNYQRFGNMFDLVFLPSPLSLSSLTPGIPLLLPLLLSMSIAPESLFLYVFLHHVYLSKSSQFIETNGKEMEWKPLYLNIYSHKIYRWFQWWLHVCTSTCEITMKVGT